MSATNHPMHQDYVVLQRQRVKEVAARVLAGTLSITEGARLLVSLWREAELDEDDTFELFVVIDSETDTLPAGETRQYWNAEAFKQKDHEREKYEGRMADQVMEACKKLVSS